MRSKRVVKSPYQEGVHLASLLADNVKVCIKFPHGLGDVLMFLPVLDKLKADYPHCLFHLSTRPGCEEFDDHDEDMEYDVEFWLEYKIATAAHKGFTKNTLCCFNELGISPPLDDRPRAPSGFPSPWVGIGCTSVSMKHYQPTAFECSELNKGVLDAGLIPLDLSFKMPLYSFSPVSPMACDVRKVHGNYRMLTGIIERCFAFIGTFTGSYHLAQAIMPERTLLLCPRPMEWQRLYRREPICINQRDITAARITAWLKSLP